MNDMPFRQLYDETFFLEALDKTTCVYPSEVKSTKLAAVNEVVLYNAEVKSKGIVEGRQAIDAINQVRDKIGFIVYENVWGMWPRTFEERSLSKRIFASFKIADDYQMIADQYVGYLKTLAGRASSSEARHYSAIHLRVEIEVMNAQSDPPEAIKASVDREFHPETTSVVYLVMGQVDEAFAKPYIDAVCLNRTWVCVRKEEIPVTIPPGLLFNFDTAFTVELEILKEAHSTLLYRFSTMSMVAEGYRHRLGRHFQYYGDRTFDCKNLGSNPLAPLATYFRI